MKMLQLMLILPGETGAGVTEGTSGIQIDRGSATDAQLLWSEALSGWTGGLSDDMELIARIENGAVDGAITYYDAGVGEKRLETSSNLLFYRDASQLLYSLNASIPNLTATTIQSTTINTSTINLTEGNNDEIYFNSGDTIKSSSSLKYNSDIFSFNCGRENVVTSGSSVAFGSHNTASGQYSTVSGSHNTASGKYSATIGGIYNIASNYYSSVIGGSFSTASGEGTIVLGCRNKTTNADNTTYVENLISFNQIEGGTITGTTGNFTNGSFTDLTATTIQSTDIYCTDIYCTDIHTSGSTIYLGTNTLKEDNFNIGNNNIFGSSLVTIVPATPTSITAASGFYPASNQQQIVFDVDYTTELTPYIGGLCDVYDISAATYMIQGAVMSNVMDDKGSTIVTVDGLDYGFIVENGFIDVSGITYTTYINLPSKSSIINSDNSQIIDGSNNLILGGGSNILSGASNTVVIGSGITATTNNTVYCMNLELTEQSQSSLILKDVDSGDRYYVYISGGTLTQQLIT